MHVLSVILKIFKIVMRVIIWYKLKLYWFFIVGINSAITNIAGVLTDFFESLCTACRLVLPHFNDYMFYLLLFM